MFVVVCLLFACCLVLVFSMAFEWFLKPFRFFSVFVHLFMIWDLLFFYCLRFCHLLVILNFLSVSLSFKFCAFSASFFSVVLFAFRLSHLSLFWGLCVSHESFVICFLCFLFFHVYVCLISDSHKNYFYICAVFALLAITPAVTAAVFLDAAFHRLAVKWYFFPKPTPTDRIRVFD